MAYTPSKDYKRREREQRKMDKRRIREEAKAEKKAAEKVATELAAEEAIKQAAADEEARIEAEFEADEGILESRVFVKYSFVATCKLVTAKNAVFHLPFFLKKPVFTDLAFREMLTET